ncbi:DNA alkylation repair protein [Roseibium porphyridii]|uniref:DNA alkylation repair protein n=1 Tax=Roseibium porphyridii TaxID=2866279 RepID=A0ABY8F0T5_9HYPH|nr:DNA alkylation repair protein [Roseibium sp. KMA01]WFE87894.1 DNA alkylation repair protein [Roseibium sp. KMA01]
MKGREGEHWTVDDVLAELRSSGSDTNRAGMARFGIEIDQAFGVPMSVLRPLAKEIGRSPELARELWATGFHEARLLAILLTPAKAMTSEQALTWLEDIGSWDLCDQLTNILARRADSNALVPKLALDEREFVKRAAFALIAWRAVHAKKAPDAEFLEDLELIRKASSDGRNFVWKAVHWALRQIGKRSAQLHGPALALALELQASDDKTTRRVGKEAVKELDSEKVRRRLGLLSR